MVKRISISSTTLRTKSGCALLARVRNDAGTKFKNPKPASNSCVWSIATHARGEKCATGIVTAVPSPGAPNVRRVSSISAIQASASAAIDVRFRRYSEVVRTADRYDDESK
ncbi:unnamed protein product [Phytophthora fragariaefolia]|uniref:Unnamed protein product n=1 Tax=Phytophthora fragariaefolia TaxID=1490495 RepID=A0A9W6WYJ5_9STRA|nr:unnamed protein product [Phytophthora fragariaefolia]